MRDMLRLAQNANALRDDLLALARHPSAPVRRRVAKNPACPTDAIVELATELEPTVRRAISERGDYPPIVDVWRRAGNQTASSAGVGVSVPNVRNTNGNSKLCAAP
jgi:hypothetical protein